ncbi:hypothetical protein [Mesorhizobium muleiense]|uniref:hypothetical protein n=1 Tax=Mesorhizobium muleiense TaxID=1004279 RepID=UPI001F48D31C|nr:hypothetical protein [Mesorhizobium muleiense]MCF6109006.1 hypothetical protein [Mesorhizobium muleiense]
MSDIIEITRRALLQFFALMSGTEQRKTDSSYLMQGDNAQSISQYSNAEKPRKAILHQIGFYETYVGMSLEVVPSTLNIVELSGYWVAGDGGGATYRRAVSEPAHDGKFQSADGAWWELNRSEVTVKMFGAIEYSTDSYEQIQSFLNYTSEVSCGKASLFGNFRISRGLVLKANKTAQYEFAATIRATAPIDIMFTITDGTRMRFDGRLAVYGEEFLVFEERTCRVGIYIFNCGRAHFGALYARYFSQWGIFQFGQTKSGSNNSLAKFESVSCINCGSYKRFPLRGSYYNASNAGKSGSSAQRTILTVDTMPPPEFEVRQMCYLVISDRLYHVAPTDFSDSDNQISVFPWVDSLEGTSGDFYYIFGGALATVGNDNNVIDIGQIDAYDCAVGLWDAGLYGVVARGIVVQSSGIGLVIGRTRTGAHKSSSVDGFYCEGNTFDIVQLTKSDVNTTINCTYETSFKKCISMSSPRLHTNSMKEHGFASLGIMNGIHYFGTKRGVNTVDNHTVMRVSPKNSDIYLRDSWTISFSADVDVNRLFGYDALPIFFIGSGPNQQPTGTFTFKPPAGWKVNAGTMASFSGFSGPVTFLVKYDFRALNIQVCLAAGRELSPSITELSKDVDSTLLPWMFSETIIHTATLSADRVLTLSDVNAVAGRTRFRITRVGGGSFALSVGGLVNLSGKSWCEVVYDGVRYVLVASGGLYEELNHL